jgi:hypothetical protein
MAHKISKLKVTNHQILQWLQKSLRCAQRVLPRVKFALRFSKELFHLAQGDLFGLKELLTNHMCKC